MTNPTVAVSAPGKVLLAGGYLILDRDYTGLVYGLDSRMHVHIQTLTTSPGLTLSEIIVRSPQFTRAEWRYGFRETEGDCGIGITQLKGYSAPSHSNNSFVETALAYALTYISTLTCSEIEPALITILADRDYYSFNASFESHASRSRFIDFGSTLEQAHKTGLGSSAALVTAFTASVLSHYLPASLFSLNSESGKARLHNLAQASHCAAQGKVGSGFDVAAAVYGSCVYRRFSPSILEGLREAGSKGFSTSLKAVVEDMSPLGKWDTQIDTSSIDMPSGLRIVMCDVECGSATVGMVKKVLLWRRENPEEAALLWLTLHRGNEDLRRELKRLTQGDSVDYSNLKDIILTIRSLIREMSLKAKVPIEPMVQTDLLDRCSQLPGVVGGVVPGAGGYDALVLLVEDKESVIAKLMRLLGSFEGVAEEGSGVKLGKLQLLGAKQEVIGLKLEDLDTYTEWIR